MTKDTETGTECVGCGLTTVECDKRTGGSCCVLCDAEDVNGAHREGVAA